MTLKKVFQGIILGVILGLAALILLAIVACAPKVATMPPDCKPKKKTEYKMIKPEPTIKRKDGNYRQGKTKKTD